MKRHLDRQNYMWRMQLHSNIWSWTAHCSWTWCFRKWSWGTLPQNGQPVIFISQALTDTQKHYSNTERELLAMVMVIEKLHHYIFGRHFMVHTDHSPLVSLFENCLNDTSLRLQCLMLRLSKYQMQIKYVTHKCVPITDCMSRLVSLKSGVEDPTLTLQIANVTKTNVNWNQIKLSCLEDPTMIQLARIIQRGWPDIAKEVPLDIKPYFQYRYILHIVDGIIFLQNRIVVPIDLRNAFLQKMHDAHLGIVKSKLLGRTLVYWPNWNNDVETTCQNCTLCRENQSMLANVPKFQVKANSPERDIWHWCRRDSWKISYCLCGLFHMLYIWERASKSTFNRCNWSLEVDVL